jgi:hypothetical protein
MNTDTDRHTSISHWLRQSNNEAASAIERALAGTGVSPAAFLAAAQRLPQYRGQEVLLAHTLDAWVRAQALGPRPTPAQTQRTVAELSSLGTEHAALASRGGSDAASTTGAGQPRPNQSSSFLQIGQDAKVTSGDKVPGHPAATADQPLALYIETAKIDPSLLPVDAKPRQDYIESPLLPRRWSEVPIVRGVRLTKSHLVSSVRSGSDGRVVLGRLNGWPVAVKQHLPVDGLTPQAASKELLIEVRSAKLLSDLGIGPHFYGIATPRGESPGIVTDLVPGDFPEAFSRRADSPIVPQTFKDLDVVLERLRLAGIAASPRGLDFQYYVTPQGRVSVIDPGDISLEMEVARRSDGDAQNRGDTYARIHLLRYAATDVGIAYIRTLKQDNPTAYSYVKDAIVARQRDDALVRYLGEVTTQP